jgi:hypothetical protein
MEFMKKNSVTQRNQRMQKMALRQRGGGLWGSSRKHLQNDELVEYALGTAAGVHQYLAARERDSAAKPPIEEEHV